MRETAKWRINETTRTDFISYFESTGKNSLLCAGWAKSRATAVHL